MENNKEFNQSTWDAMKQLVMSTLEEMAAMSPGGGLYIEDQDCDNNIYSMGDIDIDKKGHVVIKAYMWNRTDLAKKTGYFRD